MINAGSLIATLDLNTSGFSRGLNTARQQLNTFTDNSNTTGTRMTALGGAISSVGLTLTKGLTVPLVGAGAAVGKLAIDYETSLAKVSTIADETSVSMETISQGVINLSNESGIAATDLNEALYQSISAGVETASAVSFLGEATKLAKAGFADTTSTVDVLTTIMNAYGMEATEVTRISDVLIQSQNLGKTTVGELSTQMGRVIPTANAYGVSLEQLSSAYVETTKNGIGTAESTTYINSLLNELGKSGTKVSDIIKNKTGKSFQDLMKNGSTLGDIMRILSEHASKSGLSLGDLFGSSEAAKAGMVLAKNAGQDFNNTLNQLNSSVGSTEEAFNKVSDTTKEKLTKSLNKFKNAGIELGTKLLPIFTNLIEGVTKLVDKFNGLDSETQSMIVNVGLVAAAVGPLVSVGGKLISGIGAITSGLSSLGGVFSLLSGPVGWVTLGITAVAGLTLAFSGLQKELNANESKLESAGTYFEDFTGKVRTNRNLWTEIFGEEIEIKFSDNFNETRTNIQKEIEGLLQDIQNYYDSKNQMEESEREAALQGITSKQLEQRRMLEEHLQTNLQSLSNYFMDEQGLTSQQTAEQQQQYSKFYSEQQQRFGENQNIINDIYKTKSEEKRELTAQEQAQIQALSEENAAIMTALTTNNMDDMLSAWKAYYEANSKLVEQDKNTKALYAADVKVAYNKLTQDIKRSYKEQEDAVRNNASLTKEQQDIIIENINKRKNAEISFTSVYGDIVQTQMASGKNLAEANEAAFSQICEDLQNGSLNAERFGMTNEEYMSMALESMVAAGASADELAVAINAIPKSKRAEVLANIQGKENVDALKEAIDSINSKTITISVNQKGYANEKGSGFTPMYATGTDNALSGNAIVAEYAPELILSKSAGAMLAMNRQVVNLEGGEKVLNARRTREMLKGNNGFDVGEIVDTIKTTTKEVVKAILSTDKGQTIHADVMNFNNEGSVERNVSNVKRIVASMK